MISIPPLLRRAIAEHLDNLHCSVWPGEVFSIQPKNSDRRDECERFIARLIADVDARVTRHALNGDTDPEDSGPGDSSARTANDKPQPRAHQQETLPND